MAYDGAIIGDPTPVPKPLTLALLLALPGLAWAEPESYAIDPVHTRVAFRVMHAGLSPSIGTVSGPTGRIVFDENDIAASRVEVELPLARLDMGDADWNRKVLRDFLDAEAHPVARFRSTALRPVSDTLWQVDGELELAGGRAPVTLLAVLNAHKRHPLTFRKTLGLQASADISRKALGIDAWPSLVGDTVHLDIAIEAVRNGDTTEEDTP